MTAAELLADLTRQGFNLAPEGDGIGVRPARRLTEQQQEAIRAHKPALLTLLAAPPQLAPSFTWDQAEAERLLGQIREALARVERAVAADEAPAHRVAVVQLWLEVAEGFVKNRKAEAARGWDALDLLRGAVRQGLRAAAGERPSPFTYTPEEEAQLCRWLESFCGWPQGSAVMWSPTGHPDPS
jgi:hypothetical protein